MKKDKGGGKVRNFLMKGDNIEYRCSASQYRTVRPFPNGLEKLYQILYFHKGCLGGYTA